MQGEQSFDCMMIVVYINLCTNLKTFGCQVEKKTYIQNLLSTNYATVSPTPRND